MTRRPRKPSEKDLGITRPKFPPSTLDAPPQGPPPPPPPPPPPDFDPDHG